MVVDRKNAPIVRPRICIGTMPSHTRSMDISIASKSLNIRSIVIDRGSKAETTRSSAMTAVLAQVCVT